MYLYMLYVLNVCHVIFECWTEAKKCNVFINSGFTTYYTLSFNSFLNQVLFIFEECCLLGSKADYLNLRRRKSLEVGEN
jgi:hypothetical protein